MIFAKVVRNLLFSSILLIPLMPARAKAQSGSVVVFQIQTGSAASASQEYISIYNNSSEKIDITNWCLIYSSSSNTMQTQLKCLDPPAKNTRLLLDGFAYATFSTNEFLSAHIDYKSDFVFSAGLASTSGHIKLLDASKTIVDKVGWGSAVEPETSAIAAPATGKILQRHNDFGNFLRDTNNNSSDFQITALSLASGGSIVEEQVQPEPIGSAPIINEILPDAEGADGGREFIELFNQHQVTISLKGYSLQIGPAFTKDYFLPDVTIAPNAYLALSDLQTGLILPNTSGSVRLVAPDGSVVSSSETYDSLGENVAWAKFGDIWSSTYSPTPNVANILLAEKPCPAGQERNPETGYCRNIVIAEEGSATTCKVGQEINPATNRCRKIPVAALVAACKAGQTRNSETGRCRSILTNLAKQPCKAGQVRNAQTGRCRNAATLAGKKPCQTGYERNAKTGRCKKAPKGAAKTGPVKDIQSALIDGSGKWWVAGAAAVGSAGYAVYEWRREAWLILEAVKVRFLG